MIILQLVIDTNQSPDFFYNIDIEIHNKIKYFELDKYKYFYN